MAPYATSIKFITPSRVHTRDTFSMGRCVAGNGCLDTRCSSFTELTKHKWFVRKGRPL